MEWLVFFKPQENPFQAVETGVECCGMGSASCYCRHYPYRDSLFFFVLKSRRLERSMYALLTRRTADGEGGVTFHSPGIHLLLGSCVNVSGKKSKKKSCPTLCNKTFMRNYSAKGKWKGKELYLSV